MSSKLNFSPSQVKEILNAHENKFFNTATKEKSRQPDNRERSFKEKKWRIRNLQGIFILIQLTKYQSIDLCSRRNNLRLGWL